MRNLRGMALAGATVLLVACGGPFGRSGDEISITGTVFSDHRVDLPCEEQAADPSRPEGLSRLRLRFTDGRGDLVGAAVTEELQWRELDYGCRFFAAYSVTLPRRVEYRVTFEPRPPRDVDGAMYLGAEDLEPQRISLAELERRGFEWSFEAEASYAVP
jgi:hypothetical protein